MLPLTGRERVSWPITVQPRRTGGTTLRAKKECRGWPTGWRHWRDHRPPAVAAALSTSAAIAARADRRARRPRSIISMTVESFVAACEYIRYALVVLGIRLVVARLFFLDGQARIDGPRVPIKVHEP